jgi:hypothetical protein
MEAVLKNENILKSLQSDKVKSKDPYRMGGRKELEEAFEEANRELREGKCTTVRREDFKKFLGLE